MSWHPGAEEDLANLKVPARERFAVDSAIEKLKSIGDQLGFPHSSGVGSGLRELRPRQGRSPWRALYSRVANTMVILAVGPEAEHDQPGFDRAVQLAKERLRTVKEDQR